MEPDDTPESETDPYGTWSDKEIDEDQIKQDVIGKRTFEAPVYTESRMENHAPENYRKNEVPRFPPTSVITALADKENTEKNKQLVALLPTIEQLNRWMEEKETGEREHCPAVVLEEFYCERVVGSKPLSKAYELIISEADSLGDSRYDYEWDVDYYEWEVTITVKEL